MAKSPTGSVVTVTGLIDPAEVGQTLMHEHVTALVPGAEPATYLSGGKQDDQLDMAKRALSFLSDYGISTVVNLSGRNNLGDIRSWTLLKRIAESTNVRLVAGFGYYTERAWPAGIAELKLDALAESYIDAAEDMWGSGVPAGIFGEVATSLNTITGGEERALRAAAIAQRETGRPISTHASLGTMGQEQLEILVAAGADLEQVIIGHVDLKPEVDYLESMLRTGASLAFDTFGKEYFDYVLTDAENYEPGSVMKRVYHRADSARVDALVALVKRGWTGQLIVSTDLTGHETYMNAGTHGRYGYAFLPEKIIPLLLQRGITEDDIATIFVENPARILTIRG